MTTQNTTTTETQPLTREMAQRVTSAWAIGNHVDAADHGQVWEQIQIIAAGRPTTRAIGECMVCLGLGSPSIKVRID